MTRWHTGAVALLVTLATLATLAGCATPSSTRSLPPKAAVEPAYADLPELAALEPDPNPVYRLGEGDHIQVHVWGRPELSARHIVGPDARISLPLAGTIWLNDATREEAAARIRARLTPFYTNPVVSLGVEQYTANRVTVLGRVQRPGVITFERQPTLLEALARAGAWAGGDKSLPPTRCAVIRGRQSVIWVDLAHLLEKTDLRYNLRLASNDLIYLPEPEETLVYVLGAVARPGAFRLTRNMTLMEALGQAGGPNEDAAPEDITLYRGQGSGPEHAPFSGLLAAPGQTVPLQPGDVVFVPPRGLARVGYVMRQLLPGLSLISLGLAASRP